MNQAQSHQEKLIQSSIAMTVTLISFGMLFATLFLGYFLVRFNAPSWPPVEIQDLPKLLPFISTLVMILSSWTYTLMEKHKNKQVLYWFITFALAVLFLMLQWQLWVALNEAGILVSHGMVPSLVYAFTWIHAGHIVLGIIALLWLGYLIFKRSDKLTIFKITNVGKFWHFLGLVWLLMYLMIFVL
jgi:cytochrome c oxidase subunit III